MKKLIIYGIAWIMFGLGLVTPVRVVCFGYLPLTDEWVACALFLVLALAFRVLSND